MGWAAGGNDGGNAGKSEEQLLEEGREEVVVMVRESVIWWLGRRLEQVAEVQRGMVERRVKREMERGRSVLYMVKGGGGGMDGILAGEEGGRAGMNGSVRGGEMGKGHGKMAVEDEESRKLIEQQLSPEQLQLFAQENQDMLRRYEDTLDQVRYVLYLFLHLPLPLSFLIPHRLFQSWLTPSTARQSVPCSKSANFKPLSCKT